MGRNVPLAAIGRWWRGLDGRDGLGVREQLGLFGVVLLLLWSRQPGLLTHAQFYAEDGTYWYAEAYNFHWLPSLLLPASGYMQTLQRLITGPILLAPMRLAPLLMALVGLVIQALPVAVLLSARCAPWGRLPVRVIVATFYVLIPNAYEIHGVLTNSQWHWALMEALVGFGARPRRGWGWAGDGILFLVGGLSGPFGVFLLPLLLVFWWVRRQPWTLWMSGLLGVGVLVQLRFLLFAPRIPPVPLGASVMLLLRLVGGHVFLDAVMGSTARTASLPAPVIVLAVAVGMTLTVFGAWRGGLSVRLFAVYCFGLLAASLKNPQVGTTMPMWLLLVGAGGHRYWFFPTMTFAFALAVCAFSAQRLFQTASRVVLALMLVGAARKWENKDFPDHHYQQLLTGFEASKAGSVQVFPLYPEPMVMKLVKH